LTRPQLPGLLAPALTVTEGAASDVGSAGYAGASGAGLASVAEKTCGIGLGQALSRRRQQALAWKRRWSELRSNASSGFGFVEACGLAYAPKLVADSLHSTKPLSRWEDTGLPANSVGSAPQLPLPNAGAVDATADMLGGVLAAIGLPDGQEGFAPLVLLAGHGAQTANNPLQASLDCGACGGQSGDVNARVLAHLLNHPALRTALAAKGTTIPDDTRFIAGLHNTTTDDVTLYEADIAGTGWGADATRALESLRRALAEAGRRTRAERAPLLGLAHLAADDAALAQSIRSRANDWAQVRPEWGLADNAAFIVAPRRRTQRMRLGGRSFLHDYDHRADSEGKVLELIMTAPMIVTNWINLQYHASTVDNTRYGSGNKTLHNVVGGRIGVFEGNGGDLRIGLALQSLHDGERLRHTPLRLSVFIEAPRKMIDRIVDRHDVVRQLVEHGWLHLLRIDAEQALVEHWTRAGWQQASSENDAADATDEASTPLRAPALI
ncbi:MAG: putative inorganic carbon transporter subunit DabA, partial [Burkholderiaceae bacterium]